MFGLGEYFYELKSLGSKLWVPLDDRGNPTQLPTLPPWALPTEMRQQVGPTTTAAKPVATQPLPQQQQQAPRQTGANVQQQGSAPQGEVQHSHQSRNRSAQLGPNEVMSETEKRFREAHPKAEANLGACCSISPTKPGLIARTGETAEHLISFHARSEAAVVIH